METKRRVLIFGDSQLLRRLAAALRASALLEVEERHPSEDLHTPDDFHPDAILVDAAQVAPEEFHALLTWDPFARTTLISIDPLTYQLTILSSPRSARPLADAARIIEILSVILSQPT